MVPKQFMGLRMINTMGIKQTDKVMHLAAITYYLKKLLKFIITKVKTAVGVMPPELATKTVFLWLFRLCLRTKQPHEKMIKNQVLKNAFKSAIFFQNPDETRSKTRHCATDTSIILVAEAITPEGALTKFPAREFRIEINLKIADSEGSDKSIFVKFIEWL